MHPNFVLINFVLTQYSELPLEHNVTIYLFGPNIDKWFQSTTEWKGYNSGFFFFQILELRMIDHLSCNVNQPLYTSKYVSELNIEEHVIFTIFEMLNIWNALLSSEDITYGKNIVFAQNKGK